MVMNCPICPNENKMCLLKVGLYSSSNGGSMVYNKVYRPVLQTKAPTTTPPLANVASLINAKTVKIN